MKPLSDGLNGPVWPPDGATTGPANREIGTEALSDAEIGPKVEETLQKFINMNSAEFMGQLKTKVAAYFGPEATKGALDENGYISQECWTDLCASGIMLAFVPAEAGGRPDNQREIESVLAMCANYSLPLSLMLGISGSLVVQIIQRFGTNEAFIEPGANGEPSVQQQYIDRMLTGSIAGLAVTEKGVSGAAITDMETVCTKNDDNSFHLATHPGHPKWWQGNSMGDFLVVVAKFEEGGFGALLVNKNEIQAQEMKTEALREIRYAENAITVEIPNNQFLGEIRKREFPNLFIRSRLQFIGMTHGKIQSLVDGSNDPGLQAIERASAGLFEYTCNTIQPDMESVSDYAQQANCIKALGAEWMYHSALMKRNASNNNNDALNKDMNDAFPFTRFEGPTQLVLSEIGRSLVSSKLGSFSVEERLRQIPLTAIGCKKLEKDLFVGLEVTKELSGRFGKVMALIFALGQTTDSLAEQWLKAEILKAIVDIKAQAALDLPEVNLELAEDYSPEKAPVTNSELAQHLQIYARDRIVNQHSLDRKPLVKDEIREAILLVQALQALRPNVSAELKNDVYYRLRLLQRDHWAANGYVASNDNQTVPVGSGENVVHMTPPNAQTFPKNSLTPAQKVELYQDWYEKLEDGSPEKLVVGKLLAQAKLDQEFIESAKAA